jgi:hypothetical protein
MEKLLKQLGFENMTGVLWKHEKIGIITLSDEDKPVDLVEKIYNRGYSECQVVIKSTLGIRD